MKKWVIIGGVVILLLVGFRVVSNTSFISVSVENGHTTTNFIYTMTNNSTNQITETKSSTGTFKKRVKKGSYQVLVQQGETSYFEAVNTSGFGTTKKVSATLVTEKERKFVGNNPASCFNYTGSFLVSYTCTDLYSNINIHSPATATLPTYTKKIDNPGVYGYVEGIVDVGGRSMILIRTPQTADTDSQQTLYDFNGTTLKMGVALNGLDKTKSYSIQSQNNGFTVYDNDFSKVFYYTSLEAKPKVVNLDSSTDKTLHPLSLRSEDATAVALYGSNDTKSGKIGSEIIVNTGSGSMHYTFSKNFTSATECGTRKLCVVGPDGLEVYDISGKKASLKYRVSGVSYIQNVDSDLLAVSNQGVLNLDIDKQKGFLEYSFGGYRFNALSLDSHGYVLSLTDNSGGKVALHIDQDMNNTDSIDKKILNLERLPEIKNVSAYGGYIYISPELGEYKYRSDLGGFGYDPAVKTATNTKINSAIVQSGIDQQAYKVINTLP